jgi:hypothetical protein
MKTWPLVFLALGLLAAMAALWSLMWILSSASLASGPCANSFSLFHPEFRCRQPYLALIAFVVLAAVSFVLLYFGVSRIRRR